MRFLLYFLIHPLNVDRFCHKFGNKVGRLIRLCGNITRTGRRTQTTTMGAAGRPELVQRLEAAAIMPAADDIRHYRTGANLIRHSGKDLLHNYSV